MKKNLSLLMAAAVAATVAMTGCGSGREAAATTAATTAAQETTAKESAAEETTAKETAAQESAKGFEAGATIGGKRLTKCLKLSWRPQALRQSFRPLTTRFLSSSSRLSL